LVVIPPGIELAPFTEHAPGVGALHARIVAPRDAQLVGVVGRLADVKRPEWAVDVFELLRARYPRLQLVFVGDGEQRGALERRIRALDAAGQARVHMLGAVEDMGAVLCDLSAVLLTSRSEGLPVSLIEAAAAALPVVATNVGGVAELVAHERTGFLGTTVDELAFGLAQLLDDDELRAAMGQRARTRVVARHSAQALATRLEQLYTAVVEGRRCGS
jgi:glycosyltransferase involved in cell wall biosynthesis